MAQRKDFHSRKYSKKNYAGSIPSKKKHHAPPETQKDFPQGVTIEIPQSLPAGSIGYLAFPNQAEFLLSELETRFHFTSQNLAQAHRYENLFIFEPHHLPKNLRDLDTPPYPYWCSTILLEPQIITFKSIGEAASALKTIQRNWSPYFTTAFRRGQLIQEKLPYMNLKPRQFPFAVPDSTAGVYTLLDQNTLLASGKTTSPFPSGLIQLVEDHENPPSRAYLKLQEALTQCQGSFGTMPQAGQRCLDAGACPGGWTWVLVQLGCKVYAVDRSPLDNRLMNNELVEFHEHDAFTLLPEELGAFDWIFSDVICYPQRLLEWIHRWLDSGLCKNMVCTIKMQGEIDWKLIQEFESIPNSRIFHLHYNKHELTWIHCHKGLSCTVQALTSECQSS